MSNEFELTPDEKSAVIANRIAGFKEQRYNAQISLELAERLPDDDPFKEQSVRQARSQMEASERFIRELAEMQGDVAASNGNRAQRRQSTRGGKGKSKPRKATGRVTVPPAKPPLSAVKD